MGSGFSKGVGDAWAGAKQGLGAWFDPKTRSNMLGQVARRLPTLHEDIQKQASEVSPALGLTAKIASGLIKTIPQAKLAESVLGNVANGSIGGLIGNTLDVKRATPGTYTGHGLSGYDLAKGIGSELVKAEQRKAIEPTVSQKAPDSIAPVVRPRKRRFVFNPDEWR